jgi:hypothetical protein
MPPRPDLSCAALKPRIDAPTTAHVLLRDDGRTLIVCQNDAGECQEPFVCPTEGCVIEVLEKLVEIRPQIEVVREGAERAQATI